MISVIIPIYNSEDKLQKCLDSVINQSYHNLEIICINDGSSDSSADILSKFAEQDKRIKIINQTNQGVSTARNRGLDIATGDYISFIDSDDELDGKMYETMLSLFGTNGKYYDIVHCGYRRVRPNGTTVDINGTEIIHVHNREDALIHIISGTLFTGGLWNKLFRRNLFANIRFLPELRINEDVLVCFQAFAKSKSSVFYDKALYYYNENPNSTCSATNNLIKALDGIKVSRIIYEYCIDTQLYQHAFKRYFLALISAYRAYIFENIKDTKAQRKELSNIIAELSKQKIKISFKHKFNYIFMRVSPSLYRLLYKFYDSLRTPNWDVE